MGETFMTSENFLKFTLDFYDHQSTITNKIIMK